MSSSKKQHPLLLPSGSRFTNLWSSGGGGATTTISDDDNNQVGGGANSSSRSSGQSMLTKPATLAQRSQSAFDAPQHQQQHQLDTEEAETSVFESVMRRARNRAASEDSPKMMMLDVWGDYHETSAALDATTQKSPKEKFMNAVLRVQNMKKLKSALSQSMPPRHRYQSSYSRASRAHNLLESIQQTAVSDSHADLLLLEQIESNEEEEEEDEEEEKDHTAGGVELKGEGLPLTGGDPEQPRYGSVAQALTRARSRHTKRSKKTVFTSRWFWNRLREACHPTNLVRCAQVVLTRSFVVVLGIPCTVLAWIFFYYFGNPGLDFMPGRATLAWWLNFLCRQTVTLDAARITQWILLDCLILGSRPVTILVGPAISLFCTQAKGWPVMVAFWALLDLLFLHGDNKYCTHWLYWTGLKIYSLTDANSGTYILSSSIYLRFLLALLLAGLASSIKRFWLTFRFNQRQCTEFKPRLEKIVKEMVLVTVVATLGERAAMIKNNPQTSGSSQNDLPTEKQASGIQVVFDPAMGGVSFAGEDENSKRSAGKMVRNGRLLAETSSRSFRIKSQLDPWEPPQAKSDKKEVSIRDVHLFQAALRCMNDDKPFGESFGPASDRDECILSSQQLYANLLLMNTSESPVLDYAVLVLIAVCDDEGVEDPDKKELLQRLFRPDAKNQVTELAFIQSCDAIYKRISYFRASVGNTSVIDNVLAGIVDVFFYAIMAMMLLSLLEFNPWALLVSLTSLLVSVSFALGPSVSKYVEGVMLIAVTRPFDLGDRIYIGPANTIADSGMNVDMSSNTWFVEDINLSTTTLRYARTNEVSTLNNWAIAGMKIINCNRSPNAIIVLDTRLHVSVLQGATLAHFRAALQEYVETHPRTWESLLYCRHDAIDADNEQVLFSIAFRHRNSWQDSGRIKLHRADLVRFIYELAENLKVNFETPPVRRLMYQGGVLEHGQVNDFKKNLLKPSNIISNGPGAVREGSQGVLPVDESERIPGVVPVDESERNQGVVPVVGVERIQGIFPVDDSGSAEGAILQG